MEALIFEEEMSKLSTSIDRKIDDLKVSIEAMIKETLVKCFPAHPNMSENGSDLASDPIELDTENSDIDLTDGQEDSDDGFYSESLSEALEQYNREQIDIEVHYGKSTSDSE
jgi:hypothetical protein